MHESTFLKHMLEKFPDSAKSPRFNHHESQSCLFMVSLTKINVFGGIPLFQFYCFSWVFISFLAVSLTFLRPRSKKNGRNQCCGSGSAGSVRYGFDFLDPDPLERGTDPDQAPDSAPDPSIIKQK